MLDTTLLSPIRFPFASLIKLTFRFCLHAPFFTARKRSLGQGNIFRSLCLEFCLLGGCFFPGKCFLSGGASLGGASCWGVLPPRGRGASSWGVLPLGVLPLGGCFLPGGGCFLLQQGACWRPPGTATAVGGTHPTKIHSCFFKKRPFIIMHCVKGGRAK